jgi:hypothetical protein
MIRVLVKQGRGLLVVVALLAVAVAACSSGSPANSGNNATGNNGTSQPGGGGSGLVSGLSGNLDKLDSYKFTWTIAGADASATSSSVGAITGTVINKPTKSSSVNDFGVLFVTIGTDQWMSADNGATWMVNPDPASLDTMLPTSDYAAYFDAFATTYKQLGTEKKNGVDAVHFQGDLSTLSAMLGFGGVANMKADLWIATAGNYPVSGAFSYAFAVGTNGGTFSYRFDITNVNDASNKVEKPTNITELPS